jgi:hypothetical protein
LAPRRQSGKGEKVTLLEVTFGFVWNLEDHIRICAALTPNPAIPVRSHIRTPDSQDQITVRSSHSQTTSQKENTDHQGTNRQRDCDSVKSMKLAGEKTSPTLPVGPRRKGHRDNLAKQNQQMD